MIGEGPFYPKSWKNTLIHNVIAQYQQNKLQNEVMWKKFSSRFDDRFSIFLGRFLLALIISHILTIFHPYAQPIHISPSDHLSWITLYWQSRIKKANKEVSQPAQNDTIAQYGDGAAIKIFCVGCLPQMLERVCKNWTSRMKHLRSTRPTFAWNII